MNRGVVATATAVACALGCSDRTAPRASVEPPATARSDDVAVAPRVTADAAVVGLPHYLPGAIWYVDDGPPRTLVRIGAGTRTAVHLDDAVVYPSRWVTWDMHVPQLVAVASRGDGSADAEQLVLVSTDGTVMRVGPRAAMVRDPAVAYGWVVFAATLDGHSDLYRVDLADPTRHVRITDNPQGNFSPAFLGITAGDIVFASSRDGDSEIYRMSPRGGRALRLTAFHKDDWQPAVSPDGKHVAFLSDREGRPRIFVMDPDGAHQRRLTGRIDDVDEGEPVWGGTGALAYLAGAALWLRLDATTTDRDAGVALTPSGTRDAEPSFSPDGDWIVVSREVAGDTDLWAISTHGRDPVRITDGGGVERMPRWVSLPLP